jgi:thymidylate synthase ThyX
MDFSNFLIWPGRGPGIKKEALALAEDFVNRPMGFSFSEIEKRALRPFFTNPDRCIYLIHTLPEAVTARLEARFSRMNNPRGLRGVFVDSCLPELLALCIPEAKTDPKAWLDNRGVKSLDRFCEDPLGKIAFEEFCRNFCCDPKYLEEFSSSETTNQFFGNWIERFGHGSIGRMAKIAICCEGVSLMAAKALEEPRAGAGFMELSTRYVNLSGAEVYPIVDIVKLFSPALAERVNMMIDSDFELYRKLSDPKGVFARFLEERYGRHFKDKSQLRTAINGEICDVLGNLLPGATLTSLGVSVMGEAFGSLIKHLLLHGTPETIALASAILAESEKIGSNQLARHFVPSEKEREFWGFLEPENFRDLKAGGVVFASQHSSIAPAFDLLRLKPRFSGRSDTEIATMIRFDRGDTDKLPPEFEAISIAFRFIMSRRGERDIQRHVFASHERTAMSASLGFYRYDKPHPQEIDEAFDRTAKLNLVLNELLSSDPDWLQEQILSLGNLVGCTIVMNLREAEFISHQRTKSGVNHEVRQIALGIDRELAAADPLWTTLSRINRTPGYAFARGNPPIPIFKTE